MKKLIPFILFSVLSISLSAQKDSVLWQQELEQVVVTGTRTPKHIMDTPVQTILITQKTIEKTDATNVQDLLQQEMPGVEFSQAMNQQTHMNLSGFGGQSVLFLIDGERLAGETMDDVDFTRLNMSNVQRIEIVRGAASALYGSNAGGGVINIITKDANEPFSLNVNARYAPRHNEQRYGFNLGLGGGRLHNTLTANYNGSSNFDVKNGTDATARVISTVFGDKTLSVKDQVSWKPLGGLKLTGRAGYFFRTLSRTPDIPERYRDFSGGLRAVWELSENDNFDIGYAFDQYDKSDYQKIAKLDIRDYSNVQHTMRGLYNHSFSDSHILTVGGDWMRDYLLNTKMQNGENIQHSVDAFAQYDWTIDRHWELVGALRYDYFSARKTSMVTPKLSACYHQNRNLALRLGYAMGFRAPTLKELYYDFDMVGIWIVEGNPELKPEVSHNVTASADWTKGHYNFNASLYYNRVSDKLTTGVPFYKQGNTRQLYLNYTNLSRYSVYGAELTAQTRWDCGFGAKVSYSYTHETVPTDKDGQTVNNQYIPARPHSLSMRFDFDRQISAKYGFNVGINGRVLSAVDNIEYLDIYHPEDGRQTIHYPAYTIWKLSTCQRLGKAVKLTLALDNLFNYRPEYYYLNAPLTDGISFMAGLSIDIDKF